MLTYNDYIDTYFYNLKFRVYNGTYIPKHETEHIIELFEKVYTYGNSVTEVGVGSGCISISISKAISDNITFTCIECNKSAIKSYEYNAIAHNIKYTLIHSNIYNIKYLHTDILISNIPYITNDEFQNNKEINTQKNAYINVNGGKDGLTMAKYFINNFHAKYIIMELGYESQINILKSYSTNYSLYYHCQPIHNLQVFFCILKRTNTHCRT